METFAVDRSLYEMGENDLKEMWEPDFDAPMQDTFVSDSDWTALLDHQLGSSDHHPILHDRMMTDALQSPRITSEHSYSLVTNDELPDSPLDGSRLDLDQDLESECFPAIPMTTATSGHSEIFIKQEPMSAPSSPQPISPSSPPPPPQKIASLSSSSSSSTLTASQSLLKQPTIILATRPSSQRCVYVPKVNIKMESITSGFSLPPTPPSSTSSDSEGSLSPIHLQQPSSPPIVSSTPGNHATLSTRRPGTLGSLGTRSNSTHTPLISSQPKGSTGVLMLTEEEKRTLLAEGYPIPSRLPLTKAEEKSLKKIRRKIKNKISAQESRRKKKEYMDALEKKVEALHSENTEYKRKVDSLENSNRSLLSQLQKLQTMVGQIPNRLARNISTQTTTLMVLVMCFALTFGLWGTSFSLISSSPSMHLSSTNHPISRLSDKLSTFHRDPYSTPNRRSRFLLALLDETEVDIDDEITYKDVPFADTGESVFSAVPEFTGPNILNLVDDHWWGQTAKENVLASETANELLSEPSFETTVVANLNTLYKAAWKASVKPSINSTTA